MTRLAEHRVTERLWGVSKIAQLRADFLKHRRLASGLLCDEFFAEAQGPVHQRSAKQDRAAFFLFDTCPRPWNGTAFRVLSDQVNRSQRLAACQNAMANDRTRIPWIRDQDICDAFRCLPTAIVGLNSDHDQRLRVLLDLPESQDVVHEHLVDAAGILAIRVIGSDQLQKKE